MHLKSQREFKNVMDSLMTANNLNEIDFKKEGNKRYVPIKTGNPNILTSIKLWFQNTFTHRRERVVLEVFSFIKENQEWAFKEENFIKNLGSRLISELKPKEQINVQDEYENLLFSLHQINENIPVRADKVGIYQQKAIEVADSALDKAHRKGIHVMKRADEYQQKKIAEADQELVKLKAQQQRDVDKINKELEIVQKEAGKKGLDLQLVPKEGKHILANLAMLKEEIPFFDNLDDFRSKQPAKKMDSGSGLGLEVRGLDDDEKMELGVRGGDHKLVKLEDYSEDSIKSLLEFAKDNIDLKNNIRKVIDRAQEKLQKPLEKIEAVSKEMMENFSAAWEEIDEVEFAARRKNMEESYQSLLDDMQKPIRDLLDKLDNIREELPKMTNEKVRSLIADLNKITIGNEEATKKIIDEIADLAKSKTIDADTQKSLSDQLETMTKLFSKDLSTSIQESLIGKLPQSSQLDLINTTDVDELAELYWLADYLSYDSLKEAIATKLPEQEFGTLDEVISFINKWPVEYNSPMSIKLNNYLEKFAGVLLLSDHITTIPSEYLLDLLKKENLQVFEGDIFNALLRRFEHQAEERGLSVQAIMNEKIIGGERLIDHVRFEQLSKTEFDKMSNLLPEQDQTEWAAFFNKTKQREIRSMRMGDYVKPIDQNTVQFGRRIPVVSIEPYLTLTANDSIRLPSFTFAEHEWNISVGHWDTNTDRVYITIECKKPCPHFDYKFQIGDLVLDSRQNTPNNLITTYESLTRIQEAAVYFTPEQLRENIRGGVIVLKGEIHTKPEIAERNFVF